jgi:hypothetical protein
MTARAREPPPVDSYSFNSKAVSRDDDEGSSSDCSP